MRTPYWLALALVVTGCSDAVIAQLAVPVATAVLTNLPQGSPTPAPATTPGIPAGTPGPISTPWSSTSSPAPGASPWVPGAVPSGAWGQAIPDYVAPTSDSGHLPPLQGVVTERATADRPDDSDLPQSHVIYVVPAGETDRQFDFNGGISGAVGDACQWMIHETGGSFLRVDTYQGKPDISFYQSPHTAVELGNEPGRIRTALEKELIAAGFNDPRKIYHAFVEGSRKGRENPNTTGIASGAYSCNYRVADNHFAGLTWLHESFHSLGISHTSDDEADIMSASGTSVHLDVGRDSYFQVSDPEAFDLATSPFLEPLPANAVLPTNHPVSASPGANARALDLAKAKAGAYVLDAVSVGEGPCNSLTVAITLHVAPGKEPTGKLLVDDHWYAQRFDLGAGQPTTIYASVPRTGSHEVWVYQAVDDDTYTSLHHVQVEDGTAVVVK